MGKLVDLAEYRIQTALKTFALDSLSAFEYPNFMNATYNEEKCAVLDLTSRLPKQKILICPICNGPMVRNIDVNTTLMYSQPTAFCPVCYTCEEVTDIK